MNARAGATATTDRKVILSTLWIFATLNYVYADVFTLFFDPSAQQTTTSMSAWAAFAFAVLMEAAIAMVLVSRVAKYSANRWANIVVAALHTAAVASSLLGGTPAAYYALFATVEVACTLFIIWYAWTWRKPAS